MGVTSCEAGDETVEGSTHDSSEDTGPVFPDAQGDTIDTQRTGATEPSLPTGLSTLSVGVIHGALPTPGLTLNSERRPYAYACVSPFSKYKRTKPTYQFRNYAYRRPMWPNPINGQLRAQEQALSSDLDCCLHLYSSPLSGPTDCRSRPRCFHRHLSPEQEAPAKLQMATSFERRPCRCRRSGYLSNSVVHPTVKTGI